MSRNHLACRVTAEVSVLQMLALPLLEDPVCAAALSELFIELLSPWFRSAAGETLQPAPIWDEKRGPWRRQKGYSCSSCLKAQAGGGRKGTAMKLNTESTQIQEKIPAWIMLRMCLMLQGTVEGKEAERIGYECCFAKGDVSWLLIKRVIVLLLLWSLTSLLEPIYNN